MMEEQLLLNIERYLAGQMEQDELQNFEQRLVRDSELSEEVRLQKALNSFLSNGVWEEDGESARELREALNALRDSSEGAALRRRIQEVSTAYQATQVKQVEVRKLWWKNYYVSGMAAAIAILVALFFLFSNPKNHQELYAQYYNENQLPSFTTRGTQGDTLAALVEAFQVEEFEKVHSFTYEYVNENSNYNMLIHIYDALAFSEQGKLEQAIAALDVLENSESLDASRAYWYKGLVYLKAGDVAAAKEALIKTTRNPENYKFKEATSLLDAL